MIKNDTNNFFNDQETQDPLIREKLLFKDIGLKLKKITEKSVGWKNRLNKINFERYPNNDFWQKIKEYKTNSYWLTVNPYQYKLLRYSHKPVLIDSSSFDAVYFESSMLDFIKDVIVVVVPFGLT